MTAFDPARRPLLGGICLAALALFARPVAAQEGAKGGYTGIRGCAACHNQCRDEGMGSLDVIEELLPRDFCRQDEAHVFLGQDKHAQAHKVLHSDLAKRIGGTAIKDVTTDFRCLSCHSGWHRDQGTDQPPAQYEFGVSCEACHGPSAKWQVPHIEVSWREKPPDEKRALGMIDVRNPAARAALCFSCHVGNAKEGKIVTHDMYAHGHPPLPGIEVETFASEMPAHWRTIREKGSFAKRDEYLRANFPSAAADELPRTRSVVTGGVVALKASIALYLDQFEQVTSQPQDGRSDDVWPELAVFDCQACHHDLSIPSWRQDRRARGFPGRPRLPEWPTALVRVAVRHLNPEPAAFGTEMQKLQGGLDGLQQAFDRTPFGDPKRVADAAVGVLAWLDDTAAKLNASPFNETSAAIALSELLRTSGGVEGRDVPDYHSARQIAWAIRTIQVERKAGYPEFGPRLDQDDLARLDAWRKGPLVAQRDAVQRLFEVKLPLTTPDSTPVDLFGGLSIQLPSRQRLDPKDPGDYLDAYKAHLKAIASYNPDWFDRELQALVKSPEFADVIQP